LEHYFTLIHPQQKKYYALHDIHRPCRSLASRPRQ